MIFAHCYKSGEINLSKHRSEPGKLAIGRGEGEEFKSRVEALARLAYDNKTLLVPGVPEATSDIERRSAVVTFSNQLMKDDPDWLTDWANAPQSRRKEPSVY